MAQLCRPLNLLTGDEVFYLTVDVDYAHGNQFFAIALLLFLTVQFLQRGSASLLNGFAYGMAIGLVFLVRWQDVVFGLLAVPVIVSLPRRQRLPFSLAVGVGLAVGALPQLLIWRVLYGSWLTVPQSGSFLNPAHAAPLKFFFSTWNGVFLWHPLTLFGLVGLLLFRRPQCRSRQVWYTSAAVVGVIVAAELLVSMVAYDWWAGGAFGQRRLVALTPLLCVGMLQLYELARLDQTWKRLALGTFITLLVAFNLLTLLRYHQGVLPFNPADPSNYLSREVYGHYDYGRRFSDLLRQGSNVLYRLAHRPHPLPPLPCKGEGCRAQRGGGEGGTRV